ncbi:MAG TPA: tetratricopeptide repeat protein, partial [bacterium]|nr:tetratricopeptide repeat protein [bacterium]
MRTNAIALPLGLGVLAWAAAATAADPSPSVRLEEVGLSFDEARRLPAAEQRAALESVATELESVLRGNLSSQRHVAALFLTGELQFRLGNAQAARDAYGEARDRGKDVLEDAAALGEIRALELAGNDAEAAKQIEKWIDHRDDSPYRGEARLVQAWNAVRRDSLHLAEAALERLREESPWMVDDERVARVTATVHYFAGRPAEALAALTETDLGAPALYVRALSLRAQGQMLPAAARFQEIVERHPESPLRDLAMIAKADIFRESGAWRSAAEEYGRVALAVQRDDVRAEAELRQAGCVLLDGELETGLGMLREVTAARAGSAVAGRAQYLLGEALFSNGNHEGAVVEFHKVLSNYFDHSLAARAQYRIGRSLDALDRSAEATSAYQAVVAGYTQASEAPAAAYLAGVGLLESGRPLVAAPYFQIVLDRYAQETDGKLVFASPEHQELVEASLCLLQLAYHRAGDLGQLSGVPHLMLAKMPQSDSPWRAMALLVDADALASLSRFEEAQATLERILNEFPRHSLAVPANRLLAWTYARQGKDALAISTEERMIDRYAELGDEESLAAAGLHKAHILFNEKNYAAAAAAYDDYVQRFPDRGDQLLALYQSGLSHLRLGNRGDAVDRWEELLGRNPSAEV